MKRLTVFLFILSLVSLACSLDSTPSFFATNTPRVAATPTPSVPPPSPAPTLVPPSATPVIPDLTVDMLKNAEYHVPAYDRTVKLVDGKFESSPGSDPLLVTMLDQVAFGDLNGDGAQDAAVLLAENGGGSGVFVSVLAVLNQDGQPIQGPNALVDDRPTINIVSIQDGEILIDATIHGVNDPGCCAAMLAKESYRLWDRKLVISQFSSKRAETAERIISIESPANNAEINGRFVVKGSVTVSPFENNLIYSVFLVGTPDPVVQAGFTVQGDGLGGPGTFELPLDFTAAGFNGPVRIEIADLSAADGSYLAVDTLYLVLK